MGKLDLTKLLACLYAYGPGLPGLRMALKDAKAPGRTSDLL